MPGRLVGVVLAAYLSESRWLSVAVRALTRDATQDFCGQYLVRFSRPRERAVLQRASTCVALTQPAHAACSKTGLPGVLARTFESGPVALKATPRRQKQGWGALCYRAGSGKQVPSSSDLGLAGWPCAAAAITKAGRGDARLLCLEGARRFTHKKRRTSRTDTAAGLARKKNRRATTDDAAHSTTF